MNLIEKQQIAENLHERLARAKIVILTDFKGLSVQSITKLRSELRKENIEYQVVKNSLIVRAAKDTDVEIISNYCDGPNAVAISYENPVTPAKILTKFAEENDKFVIKVGAMGGKLLKLEDVKSLSQLPSREVLLSQVLSAMNGVPTAFVRLLNEVPRKMLNVLQAIKDQKEAA